MERGDESGRVRGSRGDSRCGRGDNPFGWAPYACENYSEDLLCTMVKLVRAVRVGHVCFERIATRIPGLCDLLRGGFHSGFFVMSCIIGVCLGMGWLEGISWKCGTFLIGRSDKFCFQKCFFEGWTICAFCKMRKTYDYHVRLIQMHIRGEASMEFQPNNIWTGEGSMEFFRHMFAQEIRWHYRKE